MAVANRSLTVTTPLGPDVLQLVGFSGREGLSQLFQFQLDLVAESAKDVDFAALLGQKITIHLAMAEDKKRHFSGICKRVSQGGRDDQYTNYRLEVVPQFWLLSKRAQSRIFQQTSVPDILAKVLEGLDVEWDIQGTFQPRDYCVQYRETDFNFACRMMEEEGIYYFFKHTEDGHKLVVANTPSTHAALPEGAAVIYEAMTAGAQLEDRIFTWEKVQELRSGKFTLWDHTFELPHQHLDTEKVIQDTVQVGTVAHKLKVADNDKLEIYDYPGEYAQRFDGVDPGGGDQADEVKKIFEDNSRTVAIRMQQEAVPGLVIQGSSMCRRMVSGHKFTLERHFNADGDYVVTSVQHSAKSMEYRSGSEENFRYENSFTCIPLELPFRPPRTSPKPVVQGSQTAVVVGPDGDEIFCDKYSRVKVKFHWDRSDKKFADCSCWVRVSTIWAGKGYGVINVPRIGQEVIVDFLEGDPDQPIIVGSVYNADQMPAFGLPGSKMVMGFKSNSTPGGGGYNEMTMDDTKGTEQITIHGQFDMNTTVEHDQTTTVHNCRTDVIDVDDSETVSGNQIQHVVKDQTVNIDANRTETVGKDETITVHGNRGETVDGNETLTVSKDRTHTVSKSETLTVALMRTHSVGINETINVGVAQEVTVGGIRALTVGKSHAITVGGAQTMTIGKDLNETVAKNHTEKVGKNLSVTTGKDETHDVGKKLSINVKDEILLKTGKASILMKKDGTIQIEGKDITIKGTGKIVGDAKGNMTLKGSKIAEN